ncbi:hypothetical protein DENSPDRAFT_887176 [Dentipellis sp. KUC8613]|nr:hypothetical protein DENSPDRAFT_887176 [Dentipellis sp. KUC8613]
MQLDKEPDKLNVEAEIAQKGPFAMPPRALVTPSSPTDAPPTPSRRYGTPPTPLCAPAMPRASTMPLRFARACGSHTRIPTAALLMSCRGRHLMLRQPLAPARAHAPPSLPHPALSLPPKPPFTLFEPSAPFCANVPSCRSRAPSLAPSRHRVVATSLHLPCCHVITLTAFVRCHAIAQPPQDPRAAIACLVPPSRALARSHLSSCRHSPSCAFMRHHGFYLAASHVASPSFSPVTTPSCRPVHAVLSLRCAAPSWRHTAPCGLWGGPSCAAAEGRRRAPKCRSLAPSRLPHAAVAPLRRCCTVVPPQPAVAPALSTPSVLSHAVTLPPHPPTPPSPDVRVPSRGPATMQPCTAAIRRRSPPLAVSAPTGHVAALCALATAQASRDLSTPPASTCLFVPRGP